MMDETERIEHDRYREWLTLEPEGSAAVTLDERRRLERHMSECSECQAERRQLARMDTLLGEALLDVRAGFRQEVMRSLPAAGWEGRSPRAWGLPVAVMLLLGAASALLLGLYSAESVPGIPLAGALTALAEAVSAGVLAGSGMLWASWRGIGLTLDTLFSPSATVALVVFVASLDILLLTLVARSGKPAAAAAGDSLSERPSRDR